jgi:palmitoyltransferase ZDHHC9/14/18
MVYNILWIIEGNILNILSQDNKGNLKALLILIVFITCTYSTFKAFFSTYENNFEIEVFKTRFLVLLIMFSFFLCKTILQDPGVLPRSKHFDLLQWQKDYTYTPKIKNISVNNRIFHSKFCETCQIWRPPRTSHCSLCNYCIFLFDHHCPWIGTCIGPRNYKSFVLFINFLFWYLFLCVKIYKKKISEIGWCNFKKNLFNISITKNYYIDFLFYLFISLNTIIGIIFTGLLICFHFYLHFRGLTTSEIFKFSEKPFWAKNPKNEMFIRFRLINKSSLIKGKLIKNYCLIKIKKDKCYFE